VGDLLSVVLIERSAGVTGEADRELHRRL
jgi:hypothetical protein